MQVHRLLQLMCLLSYAWAIMVLIEQIKKLHSFLFSFLLNNEQRIIFIHHQERSWRWALHVVASYFHAALNPTLWASV